MAKNEEKDLFGGKGIPSDKTATPQSPPAKAETTPVKDEPAPPAPAAAAPAPAVKASERTYVYNASGRDMRDPHTGDKFPVGRTVRVRKAGGWTLAQLQAGLFRVGSADDVGEEPENNSDFLKDQKSKKEGE